MTTLKTCKPPDPDPYLPRDALIPGACDSHCHVFGPQDRYPYAADRAYTPPDAPLAGLQQVHDIIGIGRAVIVQASCHGADNTAMLDAIATRPAIYRGVALVDGHESDGDYAVLHQGGIRWVRFNFVRHLGGMPEPAFFHRTMDRLAEMGWHVVLHLDAEDILNLHGLLTGLKIPFIIDHMGRVRAAGGLEQAPFLALLDLMRNDLAWVKICGPERVSSAGAPFVDAVPFARALYEAAPSRVLWGTDWPHPNIAGDMPNDGGLVDLFHSAVLDDAGRRAVLVDNPTRLYWP